MQEIEKKKSSLGFEVPEGWKVIRLGQEIESLEAGVSVNSTDDEFDQTDYCILKTSAISNGGFNPEECKKITETDLKRARVNPIKGSILISRMNTPALVGECGFVEKTYSNLFLPDRLWQTKFCIQSRVYPRWLNYLLNTSEFKLKIKSAATGTSNSMKNISKNVFLSLNIPLPPLPEQRAIADCLSTWDGAIQAAKQLIRQKELQKKWLMQQLLTGKKRLKGFSGEWREIHIRDIAKEVSLRNKNDNELIVLSCTKYDGLVSSLEYFGRKVFSDDLRNYKIVPLNHFAYATNHIEEGSIGFQQNHEKALISPMYTVFKTDRSVNDGFFFRLLKSHSMIYQYQNRMEGSIDRRGGLRWSAFSIIRVKIPTYEEQTAINIILSESDRELDLLRNRLEKIREQKKGLMQVLLTGKRRLMIKEL
jgi:type I restriction enzyme S subunit